MSRKLGKTLSLKQWMLRSDTLKLYRDIWRTTKGLQDPIQKKEIREYARSQFDEMRHVTDDKQIRYLVTSGKWQLDDLTKMIGRAS